MYGRNPDAIGLACSDGQSHPDAQHRFTSKLLAPNWSEALVIVDDPGSGFNPGTPQLACGSAGTVEPSPGLCTITGKGTGVDTGTGARPNVFQGRQISNNQLLWTLPMDAPASGGLRLFRITTVRANDDLWPAPFTADPDLHPVCRRAVRTGNTDRVVAHRHIHQKLAAVRAGHGR